MRPYYYAFPVTHVGKKKKQIVDMSRFKMSWAPIEIPSSRAAAGIAGVKASYISSLRAHTLVA
jgi:hypothetical protein